jgi:hypothetical protein
MFSVYKCQFYLYEPASYMNVTQYLGGSLASIVDRDGLVYIGDMILGVEIDVLVMGLVTTPVKH